MWSSLKRLALGFFLLFVTSSLLLMADWNRRKPVGSDPSATATKTPGGVTKQWQLHLVEYTNVSDVEDTEHGVLSGLKESGLVEGRDYLARHTKKCSR